jgi:hypothetical protein
LPERTVIVFFESKRGGVHCQSARAASSLEAAARAYARLDGYQRSSLNDDGIATVVVEGVPPTVWNAKEFNAAKPNYRHTIKRVRDYALERNLLPATDRT